MTTAQFIGYLVAELICGGAIIAVVLLGVLRVVDWWCAR